MSPPALPPRDDEGYLLDPDSWSEEVARAIATELGPPPGEDHWHVLHFMREQYEERRVAVDARHVMRDLDKRYPGEGRKRLFELFPSPGGARLAGPLISPRPAGSPAARSRVAGAPCGRTRPARARR